MAASKQPSLRLRDQDLAGKVAVVTGGSRGIGRAIVLNLASRGCSILATCSKKGSLHLIDTISHSVDSIYENSPGNKPKISGLAADILEDTTPERIANSLERQFSGKLDIFVNNACVPSAMGIGELTDEHIHDNLMGNIETPVKIVEEFVKRKMFRPASKIICISSVRARKGWSQQIMYMATKSANESMCRSWSAAFGGRNEQFDFMAGTTANAVMVGLTRTDSVYNSGIPEDVLKGFEDEFVAPQDIPRVGMPEDVADVVGLLCREESRWITGSVVSADGGGISIL